MNTVVNFEIAKLLKEKGFEGTKSPLWYYKDGTLHKTSTSGYKGLKCWNTWDATQGVRWDAPTIGEVVMWLYENHKIWISVDTDINGKFRQILRKHNSNDRAWEVKNTFSISEYYSSPAESYEAGIKHSLENLL